ncbi:MAG TPA: two-component sensor histidine kinase, partial [Rhodospirillaceae bacterium]|nr:two-component sensor histidine kinase [Rhodospirillaceae bacterium]
ADTGIGMDAEELETALSRFGQVGHTMTRDHQGTGLGLPLAIELAKTHGAITEVVSAKSKGTRVNVDFPPTRVSSRQAPQHLPQPRLTVV